MAPNRVSQESRSRVQRQNLQVDSTTLQFSPVAIGGGILRAHQREADAKPQGRSRSEAATIHAEAANTKFTTISDHCLCGGVAHSGGVCIKRLGSHTKRPNKLIMIASRVTASRGR